MGTLLIGMVTLSFIVAMLTAGKESDYGIREKDLNK